MPFIQHVNDGLLQSAIVVTVNFGVLEERPLGNQLAEALNGQKMVIKAILLFATRLARRTGDGVLHIGVLLKKHIDKSGLSAPRRRGKHDEQRFCLHS